MKLNNIKKIALIATTAALFGTSCKTDYDINTSEENLTANVVDYRTIMPSAMASTARIVAADWKFLQNWMGYWARSGSYQNVADEETYSFTNDFPVAGNNGAGNAWNDLYYNASNYNYIQQNAAAGGAGIYEAIARIMKAHDFQMLVDVYGNVPYFQALKGNDVRTPAYDDGADIYNDLFKQLDTAITLLKDPVATTADRNINIGTNDLLYHGDVTGWIKFANTLKLRLIIHAYESPDINIAAEMAKIEAEGSGFLNEGETAVINPGYSTSKPNPFYRAFALNENSVLASYGDLERANEYAIGYYELDGDPRLDKFYIAPDGDPDPSVYLPLAHKGVPYGFISGSANGFVGADLSSVNQINTSSPNTGSTPAGAASDAWYITSFESLFLQAEARERGIITTGRTAEELLLAGMSESFAFMGLSTDMNPGSDLYEYIQYNLTFPDVDYNATGGGLYTIISQKWFALNNFAPLEVWTDWRRTDVVYGAASGFDPGPPLSILSGAATEIPVRLFYPLSEYSYNTANVTAEGDIDVFNDKIFWDLN